MKNYYKISEDTLKRQDLDPVEKLLYSIVTSYKKCYLSNDQLEELLGISARTIRRKLERLKELKLIETHFYGRKYRYITKFSSDTSDRIQGSHRTPVTVTSDTSDRSILERKIKRKIKPKEKPDEEMKEEYTFGPKEELSHPPTDVPSPSDDIPDEKRVLSKLNQEQVEEYNSMSFKEQGEFLLEYSNT